MFGMGFFEILLIAVIAIIALGPEKLPKAMVEVAKFLKKFKSGVEDAKSTLDNELNISEMREEANKYKAQIENVKSSVSMDNLDLGVNDLLNDDLVDEKPSKKDEKVSFKSQKKKNQKKKPVKDEQSEAVSQPTPQPTVEDIPETQEIQEVKNNSAADKFKVIQSEDNK